jgi:hypothetical protein
MKFLITLLVLCALLPKDGLAASKGEFDWPVIRAFTKTVLIPKASEASLIAELVDMNGKPVYRLECHTAAYEGDPGFDYSGDFECRLVSLYSKDAYSTLLTDNPQQSRDWESRGRFLVEELVGKCRSYPEYGATRHFRLRGMKITLSLREIRLSGMSTTKSDGGSRPKLVSFRFNVSAQIDRTATSEIAEPVPFLNPPFARTDDAKDTSRKCDVVLRR